ncbi:hypothetical protein, partial [Thermophilibacter provencensis]
NDQALKAMLEERGVNKACGAKVTQVTDDAVVYEKDGQTVSVPADTVYEDRSFDFVCKTPPAAQLIKKELGLKSGSGVPQRDKVGQLTQEQLTKIAEIKMPDLNANDIEAAKKIVAGTARSMGVTIAE